MNDDEKALSGLLTEDRAMADFWACVLAEIKALGAWCVVHGPEIWLAVIALCVLSFAIVLGMWLAALLSANKEDDDDR